MTIHSLASLRRSVQNSVHRQHVVLKLLDEFGSDGVPRETDYRHLDALARMLRKRFPGSVIRPLFSSLEPKRIQDLMTRAASSWNGKLLQRNLLNYYRITCRDDLRAGELARSLAALPNVERAYVEGLVTNAGYSDQYVKYKDDAYAAELAPEDFNKFPSPYRHQGYLDKAPYGIDARYAWGFLGGDGAGTSVTAVQTSWNPNHQDLLSHAIVTVGGVNKYTLSAPDHDAGDHGTSMLGIVCGDDANPEGGIVGIAPHVSSVQMCSSFQLPPQSELTYADAILRAIDHMSAGDVLLLPLQVEGKTKVAGGRTYIQQLPIESEAATRDAIKQATANGIIVVEGAGNGVAVWEDGQAVDPQPHDLNAGGVNLEAFKDAITDRHVLNRHSRAQFDDSGAIMVGAAFASAVGEPELVAHVRADKIYLNDVSETLNWIKSDGSGSNYGSRVDCYAWGQRVFTARPTGNIPNQSAPAEKRYGATAATSGASAIIAGAALCIQGIHKALHQVPLLPADMRRALSDTATGTPQDTTIVPGPIGVMPDLRRVVGKLFPSLTAVGS